jgi:sialate O-acetylesterase
MTRIIPRAQNGIGENSSLPAPRAGTPRHSAGPHHLGVAALAALLLLSSIASTARAAAITFQSGISNGMVIQRGMPVSLGGKANANTPLTITLASQSQAVQTDATGQWSVRFPALPAGGPHTLTASGGGYSVEVDDVWIGDVWLAAGQSNMQMGLAETIGGREALEELRRRTNLRFLEIPRGGADAPRSELDAEWTHGSPESLARFSAVAGYFAEHLQREPSLEGIPMGFINSSFGGTSIEAWSPADSLADIPKDQLSGSMFGIPPGALYNHMIHPLLARPIKGVLWYQGEANAGRPALYVRLLRNLMEQWRKGWAQNDLPFLVVQLPSFDGTMGGLDFGWLREAQHQACVGFPNAWSAVTYDTTDGFDLHPKEKEEIGRRLALIAKREVYGLEVDAHGPRPEKVEPEGSQLVVTFDQALTAPPDTPLRGFSIAGEDADHRFAKATLAGNRVILESDSVPQPKTVRYAWGGLTDANLRGSNGLPAFPFRTDDFPPDSVVFQPMPAFRRIETPVYQLETGSGGRIASLIVHGRQFLSNELPGGTAVPGGFGFRNLAITTVRGPRRIALSDGGVTLEVACRPSEMTWTLTNHGNDPVDLHINLAGAVEASSQGSVATLRRDGIQMRIEGIDRLEGRKIIAKAPPNASGTLQFSIENP